MTHKPQLGKLLRKLSSWASSRAQQAKTPMHPSWHVIVVVTIKNLDKSHFSKEMALLHIIHD